MAENSTAPIPGNGKPVQPETPRTRESIAGRYRLDELVGSGGFGQVWRAEDLSLKRVVAVKVPNPHKRHSTWSLHSLINEARKAAALHHPGIVAVYDVGNDPEPYIVSQFVDGANLASSIGAQRPSFVAAASIVADVAQALHHAHSKGFVHRDIKPGNILIDKNGRAILSDFGLAVSEEEQLRESPAVLGTVSYMSPEQARGQCHLVRPSSDLYSLGVVLYELLTGRVPFIGDDSRAILEQIRERPPLAPRTLNADIPEELEAICLKCLRKSAEERYATAADLARALRGWLQQQLPRRSRSVILFALAAAVLGLLFAGLLFVWFQEPPSPNPVAIMPAAKKTDESPRPGIWYSLLNNEPKRLSFAGEIGWKPGGEPFWINSTDFGLVSFGTAERPGYKLRLRYKQDPWHALSVFFGMHETFEINERGENSRCYRYQLLTARKKGSAEWRFLRSLALDRRPEKLGDPFVLEFDKQSFSYPAPRAYELELTVDAEGLAAVHWDGNHLQKLDNEGLNKKLRADHPLINQGAFGIHTGPGSTLVLDLKFSICTLRRIDKQDKIDKSNLTRS